MDKYYLTHPSRCGVSTYRGSDAQGAAEEVQHRGAHARRLLMPNTRLADQGDTVGVGRIGSLHLGPGAIDREDGGEVVGAADADQLRTWRDETGDRAGVGFV